MKTDRLIKYIISLTLLFAENASDVFCRQDSFSPVYVAFRIDDYGIDNFEVYKHIIPVFNKYNIPLTVGVVPFRDNTINISSAITEEMVAFLQPFVQDGLVEIALHGYLHDDTNISTSVISEFVGLPEEEQYFRLSTGKSELEQKFSVLVTTFIPPWNAYDEKTLNALTALNFRTISAARYGHISFKETDLRFIPYTSDLCDIQKALYKLEKNDVSANEKLVIVLLHDYSIKVSGQDATLDNIFQKNDVATLDKMLQNLSQGIHLKFVTLENLSQIDIDFSSSRLMKSYLKTPLLPLPTILTPGLATYYKNYSHFELIFKVYIVPITVYFFLVGIGIGAGCLINMIGFCKIYKIQLGVFLLVPLLIICWLILFGYAKSVGIMASVLLSTVIVSFLINPNIIKMMPSTLLKK